MYKSRTKTDLIIEVWEKLDCENVGRKEIVNIEEAVRERFGEAAVDSPMIIARLLADEGAELRHSEIMALYLERQKNQPYAVELRNILDLSDLKSTLSSIRNLENLRKKFKKDNDKEGLREVRETALRGQRLTRAAAEESKNSRLKRQENVEIAEWLTLWLQSPEVFENWVKLRRNSADFIEKFGSN